VFGFNIYGWAFFIGSSQIAFVNKTNALTYIMCTLEMEGKKYGITKLVASATNVVATYMQLNIASYLCHTNLANLLYILIIL
jgi:hypothetical protein